MTVDYATEGENRCARLVAPRAHRESNGGMFRNGVGALVAAARRTGAAHTLDTMSHFPRSMEMIIVGCVIGLGRDKGDVEKDEEGLMTASAPGQRMAWLLKKFHG